MTRLPIDFPALFPGSSNLDSGWIPSDHTVSFDYWYPSHYNTNCTNYELYTQYKQLTEPLRVPFKMAKFCLRAVAIVSAAAIALSAVEVSSFQHAVTFGMKLPAQRLSHFSQKHQHQHHFNKAASTAGVLQVFRRSSASKVLLKAAEVGISETSKDKVVPFPIVLWRFTRPHTLIGSALAIPALHILAAPTYKDAFTTATAISTLFAMIPSLLMNLYITGLNQITDVEIDKINKPKLPIAAGDLTPKTANLIVTVALILSLAMGMAHPILGSRGLNVALWGSGILGTMYSLEPVRLKRFPLFAAFCIVAVRGAVINAGFYAHATSAAYGVPTSVLACLRNDMRCLLSSSFFAVFGIVIGKLISCLTIIYRLIG